MDVQWTNILTVAVAILALVVSMYNTWYAKYRDIPLKYVINKWTLLPLDVKNPNGNFMSAAFLVEVSIINQANETKVVEDIVLRITDIKGNTFLYSPLAIFDFKYYSASNAPNMLRAQKGLVPLPIGIPPKSTFRFEDYLLMVPYPATTSFSLEDQPLDIRILVVTQGNEYLEIGRQVIGDASNKIKVGRFAAVESTQVLKARDGYNESLK